MLKFSFSPIYISTYLSFYLYLYLPIYQTKLVENKTHCNKVLNFRRKEKVEDILEQCLNKYSFFIGSY